MISTCNEGMLENRLNIYIAKYLRIQRFGCERNTPPPLFRPYDIQSDNKTCKGGMKISQCVNLPYFIHLTIFRLNIIIVKCERSLGNT